MNIEIEKTIPGIKKLAQAEEAVYNKTYGYPVLGQYYVDGIRYDTGRSQEARGILQHHRNVLERFRALNMRINNRAEKQSFVDPVLKDSETVLAGTFGSSVLKEI